MSARATVSSGAQGPLPTHMIVGRIHFLAVVELIVASILEASKNIFLTSSSSDPFLLKVSHLVRSGPPRIIYLFINVNQLSRDLNLIFEILSPLLHNIT